jgi:hypothetical protein
MQLTDKDGNVFGIGGLEITTSDGKPKIPVINTDITIGVTSIVGGVSGRLLFDDAGVVGETNGVFWDNVNNRLGINTTVPTYSIQNHFAFTGVATTRVGLYISDTNIALSGSSTFIAFGKFEDGGTFSGLTSGIRNIFLGNNGFEQGLAFHTASGGVGALNSPSSSEVMRITNTKNLLINTTTDAGYKTDINGTLRLQSSLILLNPAFTFGGSITHSANATLVMAGGPGGTQNITFGPSNRIFINAQQSRFPNGSVQIASTLTLGNSANASNTSMLLMQGSITASSSIARGISLDTALTQSAANDVLTAVNIAPTFTVNNTLFHDVYWMRFTGSYVPASFTGNNNAATIDLSNSFTNANNAIGIRIRHTYSNVQNGYGILIESPSFIGIAQTSLTSRNFLAGTTVIGSSIVAPAAGYTLHVTNNTNGAIKVGSASQGSEHLIISHSQAGSTFSSIRSTFAATGATMLIDVAGQNNLRLFGTGNVAINSTTDNGFRLNVNGSINIAGGSNLNFSNASLQCWITTAGTTGLGSRSILLPGSGGNGPFTFYNASGQGISIIDSTGDTLRFGPGNTSSTAIMSINKSASSGFGGGAFIYYQTNANNRMYTFGNPSNERSDESGSHTRLAAGAAGFLGNGGHIYLESGAAGTQVGSVNGNIILAETRGNVLIGTSTNVSSAIVNVNSTTQGFLPPRMTNTQMLAIATPAAGLIVYDTTNNKHYGYDGTTWNPFY